MNEIIFFFHIILAVFSVLGALRLGKSALIALMATQGVLANLFVLKQISLFGLTVTCSDVFAIGTILSLNLLQEYFGKETAKKAIQISIWTLLFVCLMSQIHLVYVPALQDHTQTAFETLLSPNLRIVFASIGAFYLVQQIDVRLFSLLRGPLALRVGISLIVSQCLDTVLFSFLGLYGLVESIFDVILVSFCIKCLIVLASAPFVSFSKKVVKDVPL